jgi:hypothetical protein
MLLNGKPGYKLKMDLNFLCVSMAKLYAEKRKRSWGSAITNGESTTPLLIPGKSR